MLSTERVTALFADAWLLYEDAIEELQRGKIRNSAEKAWGATKRATDALLLSRNGREPGSTGQTSRGVKALSRQDSATVQLALHYTDRAHTLHGRCFYDNDCEPEDAVRDDIRDTAQYIRDAEVLAES
jgi:hypothetical protein